MMILDACNTSAALDIDGAEKSYKALTLSDIPGENVSDLATVALKHIKIMSGAYALPAKLGTLLLLKVCKSSIETFNRNILNCYVDADAMETRYAPSFCATDPDYSKYGSIGICGYLQDEYGKIFKNGCWPALTDVQQPEGNNTTPETPTPSPTTSGDQPRADGRTCYTCGEHHLRPDCPRHRNSSGRGGRERRRWQSQCSK